MSVITFVKRKFKEYYIRNISELRPPPSIDKREFGFIPFKKEKTMIRHKSFRNIDELSSFLTDFVPSDAYYSSTYYSSPSDDKMHKKGWLGADLVFDIDCDHIKTKCKKTHDRWRCLTCGKAEVGVKPSECPNCNSERLEEDTWICEKCLDTAKVETLKLVSLLEEDFGFSDKDAKVVFSGHRGYHVHIENEAVKNFKADERKEIVDYVIGTGLNLKFYSPSERKRYPLSMDETGWAGRIAKSFYELLLKKEGLSEIGLTEKTAKKLVEKRSQLVELVNSQGNLDTATRILGRKAWIEMLECIVRYASVPVDTVVTTDIHRLIRLPGTLHGKTGLKVVSLSTEQLYEFSPLRDALAFNGHPLKVKLEHAQPIEIGDKTYGPYENETVTLPAATAMFYICRGKASLA